MEIDVNQTVLIVVGIDLKPEEFDRPLAYHLRTAIMSSPHYGEHPFRKCLVISDALYRHDKLIQVCPTLVIGGPGVNAVAAEMVEKLPIYYSVENRYFIQMEKDFHDPRVAIWGMDNSTTSEAVETFIANGILDDFLKSIWK